MAQMGRILRGAVASAFMILSPSLLAQSSFAAPEAPRSTDAYGPDLLPQDETARQTLLKALAFDATLYGLSAYLQYEQMYRQAVDRRSPDFTGFNRFAHDRNLAGPGYVAFKVPNSDTLYSNGWLDLTRSPVEILIPQTKLSYFTLNIFDMFGNPSNLGTRTIGSDGGRFLLVAPAWQGEAPPGVTLYRASTPHLWVLMRVFAQTQSEVADARRFQDAVSIVPRLAAAGAAAGADWAPQPPPPAPGAPGLLRVLDYILRVNGHLPGEEALVRRFRPIGVLAEHPFDAAAFDPAALAAIDSGYKDAVALVESSKTQLGTPTGTGWSRVNKGKYGYNYIRRAVINAAGLGANVPEENSSFTTFVDGDNVRLDGSTGRYSLTLRPPPPVKAFWSVTLYDARSFELYPNPLGRYLVNDRTRGLKTAPDGSIEVRLQHDPAKQGNWLPAPSGPFFVVIRAYLPKPEMLDGRWLPEPIKRIAPAGRQPSRPAHAR